METLPSTFWQDRPVFVTGGSGLVGSFVVRQLLQYGAQVVCLWRDWVPGSLLVQQKLHEKVMRVQGALEDQALLERILNEYEIRTVLHLGAQAIVGTANRNPVSTFESNIRGTWCLLEACRRSPLVTEIVVASSDKAYGDQPTLPYTEDMPLLARNPYDVSKACTDMLAQSYAHTFASPVAIARCGNFFGEGDQNWNRIVPGTIRAILRNERPLIRSDGSPVRDYFYAADGAHAYLALAEALHTQPTLRGEAFNFSSGERLSALAITQRILHLMGSNLEPDIRNDARNEIQDQHLSAAKAQQMLGWKPQYGMDDALRQTIDWYTQLLS